MINQDRAVVMATGYVRRKNAGKVTLQSVNDEADHWAIIFDIRRPPGHNGPSHTFSIVYVYKKSGVTRFFPQR